MKKGIFFLVVFFVFGVGFALASNVCCEKTKSNDFCVYTDEANCDASGKITSTTCEQTSYCKMGCCFDSNDGRCYKNTPRAKCISYLNSTWDPSETCNLEQCTKGCCVLAGECNFATQTRCKAEASRYMYVNMTFDENIQTERECIDQCRISEEGCCVTESQCVFTTRDKCEVTDRVNETGAGFYENTLCSNDLLACDCAKQQYTGCLSDKDGVFWFDSCGNRENVYSSDKAKSYNNGYVINDDDGVCTLSGANDPDCGNCNYDEGTLCGKVDKTVGMTYGEYSCQSVNCDKTYENAASPNAGSKKKNGESWCVYDGAVGQGKDLVGSRYFRHMCINGEELVEPCTDFREEVCIQGTTDKAPTDLFQAFTTTGDYVEAACRDNRWEDCYSCNNEDDPQKCCENVYLRDCYWMKSGLDAKGVGGVCVPEVPPGLQFWSSDSLNTISSTTRSSVTGNAVSTTELEGATVSSSGGSSGSSVCSQVSQECTVKYHRGGWAKLLGNEKWTCVENCQCTEASWVIAGNDLCKSLGDCGAYYNILGKGTLDGYVNTASNENKYFKGYKLTMGDVGKWHELVSPSGKNEIKKAKLGLSIVGMMGVGLLSSMMSGEKMNLNTLLAGAVGGIAGENGALANNYIWDALNYGAGALGGAAGGTKTTTGDTALLEEKIKANKIGNINSKEKLDAADADLLKVKSGELSSDKFKETHGVSTTDFETQRKDLTGKKLLGKEGMVKAANTALLIYAVYALIENTMAEDKDETYQMTCDVWVPPDGGSDCEKCNGDSNKPCSKYRCKSLGMLCDIINEGTKEEMCVNLHPNDASSPTIKPFYSLLNEKGYVVNEITEDGNNGFEIKGNSSDELDPFSIVSLGIQTNEPAQCKISNEHGKKYEEILPYFGNSLFTYNKSLQFNIPRELSEEQGIELTNGGEYKFYVRCKDATGNSNAKDYFIKFKIQPGPDMTPPVIEGTSVFNGAYVQAGQEELELTVYVNEPSECKWASSDTGFDVMENTFDCSNKGLKSNSIYYGLYECNTELTGIKTEGETNFYIRCKDQPTKKEERRNVNEESYIFNVKASDSLYILGVSPQGVLYDTSQDLTVVTGGGVDDGNTKCYYGPYGTNQTGDMIEFYETDGNTHKQPLNDMPIGDYHYSIKCLDIAGNNDDTDVSFKIAFDKEAPKVVYLYKEGSVVHIELAEEATCKYTLNLRANWTQTTASGTIHEISTDTKKLYVECKDVYSNNARYNIYP